MQLEARHLSKVFGRKTAVDDVSLTFRPGQIHAVLGENGAGKSTLMKLLFGLHQPTSGSIAIDGKMRHWRTPLDAIASGLGMVQQHFTLIENLSAIDNIMLGAEVADCMGRLDRKKAIAQLEKMMPTSSLRVPWYTLVEDLSVGQKQKIEILKLLFRNAQILFLDEPTAVLTPQESEDLFALLRTLCLSGRTCVLVTHKIKEVFHVCDTYTILRNGKLIVQGEVKDTDPAQLVEAMIGHKVEDLSSTPRQARQEKLVFQCKNLRTKDSERGGLRGVSLTVHSGEIVGIAGVEGAGQNAFVEALLALRESQGEIEIENVEVNGQSTREIRESRIGFVPEDRLRQGLWPQADCFENMIIGLEDEFTKSFGRLDKKKIAGTVEGWAKQFDVRAVGGLESQSGSLSGGNQQKLILAREIFGRHPNFLICQQPTRGVDLGAISLIHRAILNLREEGVGIVLISSELDELIAMSDRIIVFFEGSISGEFVRGEYDRLAIGAAMTGAG